MTRVPCSLWLTHALPELTGLSAGFWGPGPLHEAGSDAAFLPVSHLLGRNSVSKGLEEGPGLWPALGRVCHVNGGQVPGAKQEPSSGLVRVGSMRATSWEPIWEAR